MAGRGRSCRRSDDRRHGGLWCTAATAPSSFRSDALRRRRVLPGAAPVVGVLVDPSEPVFLGVAVLVGGVVALLVTLLARLRRSGRELERLNWRYLNVLEATADGIIGVQPDGGSRS